MFRNYLEAVKVGRPEIVQENLYREALYEFYQGYYAETPLDCLPDDLPQDIVDTEWYQLGGNWILVRKARYGSWERQNEMQFDGTWEEHVAAVKEATPKI